MPRPLPLPDPVQGVVGGQSVRWNSYAYAGMNPVNYVDPSGEFFVASMVLGAIFGAAIELGSQIVNNLSAGLPWYCDLDAGAILRAGAEGAIFGVAGGLISNVSKAYKLGRVASMAAATTADFAGGMAWDMVFRGETFSVAFWGNTAALFGGFFADGLVTGVIRGTRASLRAGRSLAGSAGDFARNTALSHASLLMGGIPDNAGRIRSKYSSSWEYVEALPGSYFPTRARQIRNALGVDNWFRNSPKGPRNEGLGKNIAIAEYNIEGMFVDGPGMSPSLGIGEVFSISGGSNTDKFRVGPISMPYIDNTPMELQVFNTLQAGQRNWGRNGSVDAEAKILEWFAARLDDRSTGTITLYTERFPCRSCGGANVHHDYGVFGQFRDRFPNISLEILYGGR